MITEVKHSENVKSKQERFEQDIRFRCPHCQKLYKTGMDVFDGSAPEFDCASCSHSFVLTKQVDDFGLFITKLPDKATFEACPKCSNLKPQKTDECPSCGIFVSKYLELQKAQSPVLYELNQLWQSVVSHFDEDVYHQDFLNKCHKNMALNFAFQKYSELQKTVGYDSLCAKYIKQIDIRLEQQLKSPQFNKDAAPAASADSDLSFIQVFFILVGAFGMLMLIYNKFVPTFPNFNGLVLSLTVLSFGVGLFYNSNRPLNS